MAMKKVGQRSCLARVKVHPDFLRGYQELLAYWQQQGISPRYLNPDKSMAFNCGQIGEDLLHTDPVRKEEACFAMKGLYPYPLATQIRRYWHFRDDPQRDYEKAWDPVEQAAEIIGQALESLRSGQSKFDPARGDLCRYLFWPRLDWQRNDLARRRFGRNEADRQLAEWREHPDCGDLNCKECATRYIALEPYTEEAFEEGGEEILPTYARTSQLQNIRLPGDIVAFPDLDPVAEEVLGQEGSWHKLGQFGSLSQQDMQLLDLRLIHDMRPQEIANRSGKLLKTIQNRSYRILSRMELQLSKCILSRVIELLCFNQDIHFSDHHLGIENLIYATLRTTNLQENILSPVTKSIFLTPSTYKFVYELNLAKYDAAPFVFISVLGKGRSEPSSEVYRRFQRAVLSETGPDWLYKTNEYLIFLDNNLMMVVGEVGHWLLNQMLKTTVQANIPQRTFGTKDFWWFDGKYVWSMWQRGIRLLNNNDRIRMGLSKGSHIIIDNPICDRTD